MLTPLRVRLPAADHAALAATAEASGTTASDLIQQAIAPYLTFEKSLRPPAAEMTSTTYVLEQELTRQLEQRAAADGMSLELAIQAVIRDYLASRAA
jgi:predicted HicB family RNase H-like nuclease